MHEELDDLCLLYSSGELKGADLARFEAHRPGCARCDELLEAVRASARLAELAAVSLPEARSAELCRKALGASPAASPRPRPLISAWSWLRLAGAGALVAALAVGLHFSPGRDDLTFSSLERDIGRLDRQVNSLDSELHETSVELESDIGELEEQSVSLSSQVSGI